MWTWLPRLPRCQPWQMYSVRVPLGGQLVVRCFTALVPRVPGYVRTELVPLLRRDGGGDVEARRSVFGRCVSDVAAALSAATTSGASTADPLLLVSFLAQVRSIVKHTSLQLLVTPPSCVRGDGVVPRVVVSLWQAAHFGAGHGFPLPAAQSTCDSAVAVLMHDGASFSLQAAALQCLAVMAAHYEGLTTTAGNDGTVPMMAAIVHATRRCVNKLVTELTSVTTPDVDESTVAALTTRAARACDLVTSAAELLSLPALRECAGADREYATILHATLDAMMYVVVAEPVMKARLP